MRFAVETGRPARKLARQTGQERVGIEVVGVGKEAQQIVGPEVWPDRGRDLLRDFARTSAQLRYEQTRRFDGVAANDEDRECRPRLDFAARGARSVDRRRRGRCWQK